MSEELSHNTNSAAIFSTPRSRKTPPPWMAMAVVVLKAWRQRGLSERLKDIRWNRPSKKFVLADLVCVLIVLAISRSSSVRQFFKVVTPFQRTMASIWGRRTFPSRSNFSKMLRMIEPAMLMQLEDIFLDDLLNDLPPAALKGLVDHVGGRHLIFDMDPTKMASLEREIAPDEARVPVQPRRREATAPGYPGRKRADRVRTRTTVLMSSADLWILTFGQAGNGRRALSLERSMSRICTVLDRLGIPRSEGVVRMDGEWGRTASLVPVAAAGLGFVCRAVEYNQLLSKPEVQAALARGSSVEMTLPDSPVTRQVFDVPKVVFPSADPLHPLVARIVITRFALPEGSKHRVGHLIDGWVYEFFITDRRPDAWSAPEVVSLYLGRGGFEHTLAMEDAELETDRWITHCGLGEDLWQICCQWVWNQKVVFGALTLSSEDSLERSLAFEVPTKLIDPEPVTFSELVPSVLPPTQDSGEPSQPEAATIPPKPTRGTWGPERFRRDAEGQVRCPAGHPMKVIDRRQRVSGLRERHETPAKFCASCPHHLACRGARCSDLTGRRIDLPPLSKSRTTDPLPRNESCSTASPPSAHLESSSGSTCEGSKNLEEVHLPSGPAPKPEPESTPVVAPDWRPVLILYDLAATKARRSFDEALRQEEVKIKEELRREVTPVREKEPETRAQRAHRRMMWEERVSRNARSAEDPIIVVEVAGVPLRLAQKLGLAERMVDASQPSDPAQLPPRAFPST